MQRNGDAVGRDVDSLDQEPQDARLPILTTTTPWRTTMAAATLRAVRGEARAFSVPALALAAGDPTGTAILALDLGQKTGWAVRNTDGASR
jgi:hypothetical protein